MRIGFGYDIHRFDNRRPLVLGGVRIPNARGLKGHSDADVLLHAIADALLGAVGAADLGEQFPPGDARYRNADSRSFVRAVYTGVRRRGWTVGNLDATVIADTPHLTAYKAQMREVIGGLLDLDPSLVSVKAKTTEGFEPCSRGMAAQAVVLLKRSRGKGQGARGRRRTAGSRQPAAHRPSRSR